MFNCKYPDPVFNSPTGLCQISELVRILLQAHYFTEYKFYDVDSSGILFHLCVLEKCFINALSRFYYTVSLLVI